MMTIAFNFLISPTLRIHFTTIHNAFSKLCYHFFL